eukprot:357069-Chlamydomonas_euryale.AAC.2
MWQLVWSFDGGGMRVQGVEGGTLVPGSGKASCAVWKGAGRVRLAMRRGGARVGGEGRRLGVEAADTLIAMLLQGSTENGKARVVLVEALTAWMSDSSSCSDCFSLDSPFFPCAAAAA